MDPPMCHLPAQTRRGDAGGWFWMQVSCCLSCHDMESLSSCSLQRRPESLDTDVVDGRGGVGRANSASPSSSFPTEIHDVMLYLAVKRAR